ncbi:MAG: UrcA family protein [Hyphomonadaceae bacterium]|nr:UrcA family protein [Hyphomonadaceae bacterium]
MKTPSTTHLIAAAVIAGAFTAGYLTGPAFAEQSQATEARPFDFDFVYAPEELSSTPKAEKLLKRLERKVRAECGGNRKMSVNEHAFVQACINETMQNSIAKFGSETVAQAYRTRADG